MTNSIKMIEELSDANGISGFEYEVKDVVKKYTKNFILEEDRLNNIILRNSKKDDSKLTIMLDGHSDEIGFMVKAILPNGMIKFLTIGGWWSQTVAAHKVRIKNSEGDYIIGIVASKPPHFLSADEKNKVQQISDMVIDVGATSRDEVINDLKIKVGAPIIPDVKFSFDKKRDLMIGKAFDNRLGTAAVIEAMKLLKDEEKFNIVGSIASQEEVGTRGAVITSNRIKPDLAIVFEGSPADDTHRNEFESQGALKKGPQIRHRDKSMVSNPRLIEFTTKIAEKIGIKTQHAVRLSGGTNAGKIHISNYGVPVLVLGIPVRYAHTHYGISSFKDYQETVKLAVEVVKNLNPKIIDNF